MLLKKLRVHVALGLTDKILVVDVGSGNSISEIQSPGDHGIMAFSPDGTLLASGNSSGQLSIWRVSGNEFSLLHTVPGEKADSSRLTHRAIISLQV